MSTPGNIQPKAELLNWLAQRQAQLRIVKTTTTPNGQLLDWVPIESQVPSGKIASPPPRAADGLNGHDAQKPVGLAPLEMDDPSIERGPAGTVPILRPDVSTLTTTFLPKRGAAKQGGLFVNKRRREMFPTDPNPANYFHATTEQTATVYGCDGFLSVWDPAINVPNGNGEDHSIMQTWLLNYDNPQQAQSVEAGWTVDHSLNGDTVPHIFTYYTTNGYAQDGDNLGGYNQLHRGWVQVSNSCFPGIRINGVSTVGGTQLGVSLKYQLWQGNWWFAVQGSWIGYYPGSLFNGRLQNRATWVSFGGEVYSGLADPSQTKDQMGSGRQAQEGWTKAAFQLNLRNQIDGNGTMVNHAGTAEADTATGTGPNPYDVQPVMNSGTAWGSYFYVGGPTA